MVAMQAPSSTAVQQSVMSANFNSTMLFTYLMGLYTAVYLGTLYLFSSNKNQQHRVLISLTISALFLACACIFALQWRFMEWVAITSDGETRPTIFIATMSDCPLWAHVIVVTLQYTLLVVSDGLLIWRCFHVWGRSLRTIAVPLVFLLAETGVSLAIIGNVPAALVGGPIALLMDKVQSAALFVSFFTTTITTSLIGYRIYTLSRHDDSPSTANRVKHITKVLLESSAVYCIVILVNAIVAVIPSTSYLAESPLNISSFYVQIVLYVVSGMAPTIVVARIALANPDNYHASTLTNVSGMQFEGRYIASQHEPKVDDETIRTTSDSGTD